MTSAGLPTEVAPQWFTCEEVGDGIRRITEPYVDPILRSNAWFVEGRDTTVLVDTGCGIASLRHAFPNLFATEPLVVLTHAHPDHTGSAWEFNDVRAHPAEHPADLVPSSLHTQTLGQMIGFDFHSLADSPPDYLISALPHAGFDPTSWTATPVEGSSFIAEGDVIDLGNRVFTVLHLPGHTPGGIALYDRDAKALIIGDTAYDDILVDNLDGADVTEYVASMRRLLTMDVNRAYPGHGEPFDGAVLHRIARDYIRSRGGIADQSPGCPVPNI